MMAKRMYFVSWEPWGCGEWDMLVDEKGLQKILNDCERYNWVRPEVFVLDVEDVKIYLEVCAKASVCGAAPEIIRRELLG